MDVQRPSRLTLHLEQFEDRLVLSSGMVAGMGIDPESVPISGGTFSSTYVSFTSATSGNLVVQTNGDGVRNDWSQRLAPDTVVTRTDAWAGGEQSLSLVFTADEASGSGQGGLPASDYDPDAALPRFVLPVAGEAGRDWVVSQYFDADARDGHASDFRGSSTTYDGHDGIDFSISRFDRMDQGVAVLAAADGVVREVRDGAFDRNGQFGSSDANYVIVDHGNGTESWYWHLAEGTVAVVEGQAVSAGQTLGLVGSSGHSNGPHLHFEVRSGGVAVDLMSDPGRFWVASPDTTATLAPAVVDSGIHHGNPFSDSAETIWRQNQFPANYGGRVTFWYDVTPMRAGDVYTVQWFDPAGVLQSTSRRTAPEDGVRARQSWYLNADWSRSPGTWQVAVLVDGAEVGREAFVVGGAVAGEARVSDGSGAGLVVDGRTTPLTIEGPRTFTVRNTGLATLHVSDLRLPAGLSLLGGFPSAIGVGQSAAFTVGVVAGNPNAVLGDVSFATSDPARPRYDFAVAAAPTVAAAPDAADLSVGAQAVVFAPGSGGVAVAPSAVVADDDLGGGRLTVAVVGGHDARDVLTVADGGGLDVVGAALRIDGRDVGVWSEGRGAVPLTVTLAPGATAADATAVLRQVRFANAAGDLPTNERTLRVGVLDAAGHLTRGEGRSLVVAGADAQERVGRATPVPVPVPMPLPVMAAAPAATPSVAAVAQVAQVGRFRDGQWQFDTDRDGVPDLSRTFGAAGDQPLVLDWNGDGRLDAATFNAGAWAIDTTDDGVADVRFGFGQPGDRAYAADFDGDGRTDIGVYGTRGAMSTWVMDLTGAAGRDLAQDFVLAYGIPGDVPFVGDFDGDGRADLGLYRTAADTMQFFVDTDRSGGAADTEVWFGMPGDTPFLGDYDGDGRVDPGVYRIDGTDMKFFFDTARDGGAGEGEIWLAGATPGDMAVTVPAGMSMAAGRGAVATAVTAPAAPAVGPVADAIDLGLADLELL